MDKDRITGSAKDFAGKVEGTVGNIAGDTKAQVVARRGKHLDCRIASIHNTQRIRQIVVGHQVAVEVHRNADAAVT
jgi:translation initiation factor IF-1